MLPRFEELKQSGGLCSSIGTGISILQAAKSASCGLDLLSQIAERDPASALRLVQAANQSRSYGADRIVGVKSATAELGTARAREELLRFSLASPNRSGFCAAFDYDAFWSWSLACAHACRLLALQVSVLDSEGAYLLGLTAHTGELALATAHSERYMGLLTSGESRNRAELVRLERELFEISRWEISALLLAEAGLPVEYRHVLLERTYPDQASSSNIERALTSVLLCAEAIADSVAGSRRGGRAEEDHWQEIARQGSNLALSESRLRSMIESTRRAWSETAAGLQEDLGNGGLGLPELGMLLAVPSVARPKALVAEGDRVVLRTIHDALAEAGYEVHSVTDGLGALRLVERIHPEIVIMDWDTPKLGGPQLCEELRRHEVGMRSYVIMLAEQDFEERQIESFRKGADDFVSKPVSPRLLLARVQAGKRLVDLHRQVEHDKQERLRQISELSLLTRRLEVSSTVDDLTGLPNRRYAISRLEEEWRAAERLGLPLSVIMVDVDHFKRVNDLRGHGQGDAVLQEIGMTMLSKIRRADVVCRMGGEEFLVINVDSDHEGARQCAERLRSTIEKRAIPGADAESIVTISLGVATRSATMKSSADLLKAADEALYAAKAAGRNVVCGHKAQG
jgi:diguanylate cyclase (GGDEF)-like protein